MVPLLSLWQAGSDALEKERKNVKPVKYRIIIPGRNLSYHGLLAEVLSIWGRMKVLP